MTKRTLDEKKQIQLILEYYINNIVKRIVFSCCYHVSRMHIVPETFQVNRDITHDEYKMHMLCKSIAFSIHVLFDIDEDAIRDEINELVFNNCESNQFKQLPGDPDFIHMVSNVVLRCLCFVPPNKVAKLEKEAKKHYQNQITQTKKGE